MDELFEGMAGVTSLVDDIVVTGPARQEYDSNLQAVLERATQENLKLNPDKLTVGASEIEYFGHRITSEGLKLDESKVKAILDMGPPTDKKELQTLLGMITYLSKFAPPTSDVTKPMRDLLKEDMEFVWDDMQQSALKSIKEVLTQHPVLSYFDPRKEVTLEVDASNPASEQRFSKKENCRIRLKVTIFNGTKLCTDRKRTLRNSVRLQEIPPVRIRTRRQGLDGSQTPGSNSKETARISPTKIAENAFTAPELQTEDPAYPGKGHTNGRCTIKKIPPGTSR